MPGLVDIPDATHLFGRLPNLRKITWRSFWMAKRGDKAYEVDTRVRSIAIIGPPKPVTLPVWAWQDLDVVAKYPVYVVINTRKSWSLEDRVQRIRLIIEPFTHAPITKLILYRHTWTGAELAVVADILEERQKRPDSLPVETLQLRFHLTHCAALAKPLRRITAVGTKVHIELIDCMQSPSQGCNEVREAHLYSTIQPYVSLLSAGFGISVIHTSQGGLKDETSIVLSQASSFPRQVADITYYLYASRYFASLTRNERTSTLRRAFRPWIELWITIASIGCRIGREDVFSVETAKGPAAEEDMRVFTEDADQVMQELVEGIGLGWYKVMGPRSKAMP